MDFFHFSGHFFNSHASLIYVAMAANLHLTISLKKTKTSIPGWLLGDNANLSKLSLSWGWGCLEILSERVAQLLMGITN